VKYIGSKTIETENLILRATQEEDLKPIWEILCDIEVSKFYLVGKFNFDWEKEKEWQYKKLLNANNNDTFIWSVILKSQNKCIGQVSCQLSYNENGTVNPDSIRDVGWFLDSNYHSMGFGSELSYAMINYMFNEVGIDKIETSAAISNPASWKIMEKLGFSRLEKTKMVKYTFLNESVECYCYEITKDEFNKKMLQKK